VWVKFNDSKFHVHHVEGIKIVGVFIDSHEVDFKRLFDESIRCLCDESISNVKPSSQTFEIDFTVGIMLFPKRLGLGGRAGLIVKGAGDPRKKVPDLLDFIGNRGALHT